MTFCGQMRFDKFLPDLKLGRDVLDYEIWRLGAGACLNFEALLFQAPFKSGLLVSAGVADQAEIIDALLAAAKHHPCRDGTSDSEIDRLVRDAFDRGLRECNLDLYCISRENWDAVQSHTKVEDF